MNIRRMMASGSHLWKRAFTTVAALPSAGIETSITAPAAAAARVKPDMAKLEWIKDKKRMMLVKLLDIDERAVKETIDKFKSDYEEQKQQSRSFGKRTFNHVSVTKADLYTWAKRLEKLGKRQHAIEIFEWMEEKKMSFTTDQLAFYVGLTGKVKDWETARDCNKKVDPNFNQMDHSSPALDPNFNSLSESHAFSTQQSTHCLGLNAIADVASLISPSVVTLTVPGLFGVEGGSSGTGSLIDEFGTIITCAHVVINSLLADESSILNVIVTFKDGKTLIGKTESYNLRVDIAIVKIEDYNLKIPHVDLGFSTTSFVGEWVVTVGTAEGSYPQSFTGGVVSYLNRRLNRPYRDDEVIQRYIQTDCAVNRGNSGGPLVNLNGQIIGVICMRSVVRRLAFAVPIDVVCQVIKSFGYDFTSKGYVLDFDSLGPFLEARGKERGFLAASIDDRLRNPLLAVARKDGNVEIEKAPVKIKKSKKEKRSRENVSEGEEKDELRSKKTQEHKKKTKKVKHNQED